VLGQLDQQTEGVQLGLEFSGYAVGQPVEKIEIEVVFGH